MVAAAASTSCSTSCRMPFLCLPCLWLSCVRRPDGFSWLATAAERMVRWQHQAPGTVSRRRTELCCAAGPPECQAAVPAGACTLCIALQVFQDAKLLYYSLHGPHECTLEERQELLVDLARHSAALAEAEHWNRMNVEEVLVSTAVLWLWRLEA